MIPHCGRGEGRGGKGHYREPHKIRIENATKSFLSGSVVAFENLTLDVRTEEIICILGPSSCGKTTLLKAIDGLYSLEGGRITIDGHGVDCPRPEIAMVFQHFACSPGKGSIRTSPTAFTSRR